MPTSRTFLLACAAIAAFGPLPWMATALAQPPEAKETEQVIRPEIDRREIRIPKIDTEDYELGLYVGILSIEDFGARAVYGGRLAYHVTEDFFVEGLYGLSTITDETLCNNGLCLFPNRVEDLSYYAVSLGYNLFPGEIFFGKKTAMNATAYLLAGIGNTTYVDESHFTANVGVGIRILPKDWLAVHITMRDFLFESDFLGTVKTTNNFELTLGLSVYF